MKATADAVDAKAPKAREARASHAVAPAAGKKPARAARRECAHRQVTDAWLLGLAVAHGLRVVSFDGGLPLRAVRGAAASHIVVI